jgi:E3 ubiquitin-protein ligase SIAH1
MSAHDLSKVVLKQLECSVCMEYMLPPITLCGNGHNICSSCKQKFQKCPTCREPLSGTRNKTLENLAERVECPCPNKPHGCTLTFPIALIREHEEVCQFGPFDCPLNYRIKCNWTGTLTEIKGHVLHKHKDLLRRPQVRMLELTNPNVLKYNKDKIHVDILLSNDNLFFEACEIIGDAFYYIIQQIGPEKEASQFKYNFFLESGAEEITVCKVASSYSMDVKEVYSTGKCVKLFCDIIERFVDEDKNLQFHVEIFKVKDAHK